MTPYTLAARQSMLPNPRSQTDESLIGQLTYHRLATARSGQSHGRGTLHGFCRGSGWIAAALFVLLLSGCGDGADDDATDAERGLSDEELAVEGPGSLMPDGVTRELSWDNLIPADWQPEKLMDEYDADNLDDDDPRAQELMDKLKALWSEAPVVEDLNGAQVRLPGFVVPLESDATQISEFLLVPYFGACIHVPPPPANQTVLVTTGSEQPYEGDLFDTVWVKGQMVVEPFSDELGDAGYRIEEASVSLYEEP